MTDDIAPENDSEHTLIFGSQVAADKKALAAKKAGADDVRVREDAAGGWLLKFRCNTRILRTILDLNKKRRRRR